MAAPAGTAVGDLVVVWCHSNTQTTIADNNGATPFTKASISGDDGAGNYKPNTTNAQTGAIFSRRIQSGDPATYNFTSGANTRQHIVAAAIQSPHTSVDFDVTPTGGNNADTGVTTGTSISITTTTDNAIHFASAFVDGSTVTINSTPASYTVDKNVGVTQPIAVVHLVKTPAGSTGAQTFGWDGATNYFAISLAVAPEAVVSGLPPGLGPDVGMNTDQQSGNLAALMR